MCPGGGSAELPPFRGQPVPPALLHGLAYQLLLAFRRYLEGTPWQKLEIETLRRRAFKLGARIRETTRRIWIHCSSAYPEQDTFFLVLQRICGPPG